MNVKKSLAVFAAILTAASAFAGCSSESTSTESTSAETTVSAADTAEASEAEVSEDNNQELAYEYVDMTTGDMDMPRLSASFLTETVTPFQITPTRMTAIKWLWVFSAL